jgi:hypothetical protein
MNGRESPGSDRAASSTPIAAPNPTVGSRQVSWYETNQFIEAAVAQANVGPLPWAGTPEWCAMADGDPRKLLALAVAGEHHVLRVEVAQTSQAEASRAVSAAADWPKVAREFTGRDEFYAARPWLRRAVS